MYFSPSGLRKRLMSEYVETTKITDRLTQTQPPKPPTLGTSADRRFHRRDCGESRSRCQGEDGRLRRIGHGTRGLRLPLKIVAVEDVAKRTGRCWPAYRASLPRAASASPGTPCLRISPASPFRSAPPAWPT